MELATIVGLFYKHIIQFRKLIKVMLRLMEIVSHMLSHC